MLTVSARRFDGSEDALANENLTTGGVCAETKEARFVTGPTAP